MKITQIAAKLRKTADEMEVFAMREGDLDFPNEIVLPFIVNFLADANFRGSPKGRGAAATRD